MNRIWLSVASAPVVILLVIAVGCSDGRPKRVPVSGRVLIDGQPLQYGYVRFYPQGARPSGGGLDKTGRFVLGCFDAADGAVVGIHRVEIMAQKPLSETQMQWLAPKKYAAYQSSGLIFEVSEATDKADFNLSWDGGKPYIEELQGSDEGKTPY